MTRCDDLVTVLLPTRLLPGDIVASRGTDIPSAAIQRITRGSWSHVALVIDPPSTLFHAMDSVRGVWGAIAGQPTGALEVVRTLNGHYASQEHVEVLRLTASTPASEATAYRVAELAHSTSSNFYAPLLALAGVCYEYRSNNLFALLASCLERLHNSLSRPSAYCSSIIAAAYETNGIQISDKPSHFILPKDINSREQLGNVDNCSRQIRRSWLPAIPEPPLASYNAVRRGVARNDRAQRALEFFWRNHPDPMRRLSESGARECAKEPAGALEPMLHGPSAPGALELDPIVYQVMLLHRYRERLLASARRTSAPRPSDPEWREEVYLAEDQRLTCERIGAVSTLEDLNERLEQWENSETLRYWRDAYADLVEIIR